MSGPKAWMPWYVGDYLGETARLTTEQQGAYALLICDYWLNGPLPVDDAMLAQITRLDRVVWRRHAPAVRAFFREEGGVLRHARLDKERAAVNAKYEQASERARHAARRRWDEEAPAPGDACGDAPGRARTVPQPCQSQSQPQSQLQPQSQPEEARSGLSESDPETSSAQGSPASPARMVGAASKKGEDGEPATTFSLDDPPFLSLPRKDGAMFHVAHELVARLQGQYPSVDVAQQLRQMQGWLQANPRLGKTERGMMRFVTGWLDRQQAQAPQRPPVSYLGPEDVL